jgi:hypothetical protein
MVAAGVLAYVFVGPVLVLASLAWLPFGYPAAMLLAIQTGHLVTELVSALTTRVSRTWPPLTEFLPTDVWAAVLVVPVATSLAGAGLGLGFWLLSKEWWLYAAYAFLLSVVFAGGVPFVVSLRLSRERQHRVVRLGDDTVDARVRLAEVERRWQVLLDEPRRLLRRTRAGWLGRLDGPPDVAWPSRWPRRGWRRLAGPAVLVSSLVAPTAVLVALAVLRHPDDASGVAAALAVTFAAPAVATVLRLYAQAGSDQVAADRLRDFRADLLTKVTVPSAPAAVTPWRRLLARLAGPDACATSASGSRPAA